jgi:hypothetical protein
MAKDLDRSFKNLANSGRDFSIHIGNGELACAVGMSKKRIQLQSLVGCDASTALAKALSETLARIIHEEGGWWPAGCCGGDLGRLGGSRAEPPLSPVGLAYEKEFDATRTISGGSV